MDNHASMPSGSQQHQQYYQQAEATNPNAYDPTTQAYSYQHYIPHQPQEGQPDYSSYYYPDYSNSYQSLPHADPNSIHPPGVAIPAETPQTLVQNHPHTYYSHGFVSSQSQNGFVAAPSYSTFAARGGHGDRPIRGGHRSSSRGRGKGRGGRGGSKGGASVNFIPLGTPRQVPQLSSVPGKATRCEICRVDCDTPEVLEKHKNGKKHMKNLKVHEELQNAKGQVGLQNPQAQVPDSNAVFGNNNGGVDAAISSGAQASMERDQIGVRRGGLKRKVIGGRGGKLMKFNDGSRKPAQFSKPNKATDLFCSLCSVKCESQVVYNTHMVGKKHLSNVKKLQGHAAAMPSSAVQAFYSPIPNIPSTLQGLYPPAPNAPYASSSSQDNQQHLFEPSTSVAKSQQEAVHDVHAKLVQILKQHGVQDTDGLLCQMIPVLLTHALPNGATPSVTGLVTQDHQNSVARVPCGDNEIKPETHQNSVAHVSCGESEIKPETQQNSVARVSCGENESEPETVAGENAQKTELSEAVVADNSSMGSLEIQAEVIEPPSMDATTSAE